MTTYDYRLGNGYFIKVLMSKRYTLPTPVLDALIDFFCKTGLNKQIGEGQDQMEDDEYDQQDDYAVLKEMPVMWH